MCGDLLLCAKHLFVAAIVPPVVRARQRFAGWASVLLWKIATPYRIADGSGGPKLFHHAVKFALDLVEAVQDQGEAVGGGHGG
jgi:hypothetical protein